MKTKKVIQTQQTYTSDTRYLTHNYHPYPCKFVPQIPQSMITKYSKEGDLVLDPFCGSGTTLTEASLLNRNGIGIDLNPVAVLSSKVKTTPLTSLNKKIIKNFLEKIDCKTSTEFKKLVQKNFDESFVPDFDNLNHWFLPYIFNFKN